MASRWLDLAELSEHDAYNGSLRRLAVQAAIGEELKTLLRLPYLLPPHLLALLGQLQTESEKRDGEE